MWNSAKSLLRNAFVNLFHFTTRLPGIIFGFFYGELFFLRCPKIKYQWALNKYDINSGCLRACFRYPNSDRIVFFRSLWLALWLFLVPFALKIMTDPRFSYNGGWDRGFLLGTLHESIYWFGGMWGGIYYFRYQQYSSQYLHLTQMYNSIRTAELRLYADANITNTTATTEDSPAAIKSLARWKAGFIELAEEFYLATRQPFISLVKTWGEEDKEYVKKVFKENFPGGELRFNCLMNDVNERLGLLMREYNPEYCGGSAANHVKGQKK